MTPTMAYRIVVETVGLKHTKGKSVAEAMMAVAAQQLGSTEKFKVANATNMRLKKQSKTTARKGMRSKPASQIVRASPTKKYMMRIEHASATVIYAI